MVHDAVQRFAHFGNPRPRLRKIHAEQLQPQPRDRQQGAHVIVKDLCGAPQFPASTHALLRQ
jgi:hypothetical protein